MWEEMECDVDGEMEADSDYEYGEPTTRTTTSGFRGFDSPGDANHGRFALGNGGACWPSARRPMLSDQQLRALPMALVTPSYSGVDRWAIEVTNAAVKRNHNPMAHSADSLSLLYALRRIRTTGPKVIRNINAKTNRPYNLSHGRGQSICVCSYVLFLSRRPSFPPAPTAYSSSRT
jgi:hypothetical protein